MKKKTEAKRQTILKVAAQVFQEFGFEGTRMSEICARLGGSKATLYNYFPSKDELFFEVLYASAESEVQAVEHTLDHASDDIGASIRHFGERFLTFLYSPKIRAERHLAISQSGRTNLGRIVYERGVMRTQKLVRDFLESAMKRGKLKKADPSVAARHLLSLIESELLASFLFQQLGNVSEDDIKAMTERGVDVFMAAYAIKTA